MGSTPPSLSRAGRVHRGGGSCLLRPGSTDSGAGATPARDACTLDGSFPRFGRGFGERQVVVGAGGCASAVTATAVGGVAGADSWVESSGGACRCVGRGDRRRRREHDPAAVA
jgi:hypothetical protein